MFHWFLRRLRAERGFTLIELLIVVAVMGILTAILIPNFMRSRSQAQISASNARRSPGFGSTGRPMPRKM